MLPAKAINTMIDQLNAFAGEVTRVAREVGTEGRLGGQANVPGVAGTWKDLTDSVNSMAGNLTGQVRSIAESHHRRRARRPSPARSPSTLKAKSSRLKNTINTIGSTSSTPSPPRSRVSPAKSVPKASSAVRPRCPTSPEPGRISPTTSTSWLVNTHYEQVRGIVKGRHRRRQRRAHAEAHRQRQGGVAALAETINNMTNTRSPPSPIQVTTVAREVGVEDRLRLGGQANVPGAAGNLEATSAGNVNLLADNLTNRVRAIAEVATAVAKGDLTRSIQVDASGEVAELKDNINTMIDNLRF